MHIYIIYVTIIIKSKEAINLRKIWERLGGKEMERAIKRKGKGGSDVIRF